jgi:Bacterial Ig-like domain (group 2).
VCWEKSIAFAILVGGIMKETKKFLLVLIMGFLFLTITTKPVNASITIDDEEPNVLDDINLVVRESNANDLSNVNNHLNDIKNRTYRNTSVGAYYVIYPDGTPDVVAGDIETITYDGQNYDATIVICSDFSANALKNILAADNTLFFHSGTYTASQTGYTRFSQNNMAVIGLAADVVFEVYHGYTNELNERNIFMQNGGYFANICFDARSKGMVSSSINNARHSYFFHVTGQNIAFDNITIKNLQASSGSQRNVAVNVFNAPGPIIFNNLTFQNSKASAGYAMLQVNSSKEIYFNNIDLNSINSYSGYWLKVETASSGTIPDEELTVYFTGDITITNCTSFTDRVLVENYYYKTVALPSNHYRYARMAVSPFKIGSTASPPAFTMHTEMQAANNSYALLDLVDNSFIVNSEGNAQNQMTAIINVLSRVRSIKNITSNEEFNVKYEVGASDNWIMALPNITSTISALSAYDDNIYLNIIPVKNKLSLITDGEMVKFDLPSGGAINLGANTAERYALFNIDFDTLSNLTLQEIITGITAVAEVDPYIAFYPTSLGLQYSEYYVAKNQVIENSSLATFHNCIFASLVSEIEITSIESGVIAMNKTLQLNAGLTNSNNNSFTDDSLWGETIMKDTANDGLVKVHWISTDPSIATVDANGLVTAVGPGTVTIVAKAIDENNNGEIEKPWAIYTVIVSKAPHPVSPPIVVPSGTDETIGRSLAITFVGLAIVILMRKRK